MAETGLNVKMGVSGLSKFRQDVRAAKSSMNTLEQALKLTEKEFKATGDKEKYMTDKAQLLNVKLETQKSILAEAESALKSMTDKGVDKASSAFQTMQQEVLKAKQNIIDTETEIKNIGTDSETAAKNAGDLNTNLRNISRIKSFETVVKGLDKVTDSIEKAAKKAFKLGKQLVQATLGAGSWADELKTEAEKWEITPDELQRMQMTAQIIDTDVETILAAQQKLRKATETKSGKQSLEETLGIKLNGQSSEDLFWEVGEALMNMGDEYDKEKAAQDAFGKSWRDLVPLFKAGREEYEKTNESWQTVSDEQIESLSKMDDEYQKLMLNFENLKKTALAEFAEPMNEAMTALNGLMTEFSEWLKSDEGKEFAASVIGTIKDGLTWITENRQLVVDALIAIGGAFAAIKVSEGVLKFLEFKQALSGLFGGKAAETAAAAASGGSTASSVPSVASTAGWMGGYGGAALILSGFLWAGDRRKNHAEEVRGTDENLAKAVGEGSEQLQDAFVSYVTANKALQDYFDGTEYDENTINQLMDDVDKATETLQALEGYQELLAAYSDWRQEHSYGNMDWVLPEEGFGFGEELTASMDRMNEVVDSNTTAMNNLIAGTPTAADLAEFNSLPNQILAAVRAGVANIQVIVSAQQMGNAVTPTVSGNVAGARALFRQ